MRPELDAALAAVAAARIAIADTGSHTVISKGGRDLATAADLAAEDAIRRELLNRYPGFPVVGEERGGKPPVGGTPYWLVDPICGTRAFASGIALYAINITLVDSGRVVLAAVGDGSSDATYVAEAGTGAWRWTSGQPERLAVSGRNPILWIEPTPAGAPEATARVAALTHAAILTDRWYVWSLGTSLALAYLATGCIAGLIEVHVSGALHWAASWLLASEAGATISDFEGRPWTLESHNLVAAATPELHVDLMKMICKSLA